MTSIDTLKTALTLIKLIKVRRISLQETLAKEERQEELIYQNVKRAFRDDTEIFRWWIEEAHEGKRKEFADSVIVNGVHRPMRTIEDIYKYLRERN